MQHRSGTIQENPVSYSARVDGSGRIVIPSEIRDRHHFHPGDELVIREQSGTITISSYDEVLAEAQAYFMGLAEPGVSMVEELRMERRAEAAHEAAEAVGDDD